MRVQEQVLALLERNRGHTVSGAHIAAQLGVSRSAVWKAVKELEKKGYDIRAGTNRGYCLCSQNDILSEQGILPFLQNPQDVRLLLYDCVASTNRTAKELAVSGAGHGTVVLAEGQTQGCGRFGRTFFSPPAQGIYMSVLLHPGKLGFETPTLVTAYTAVAVCEAIEAVCGKRLDIKWVNDLYLHGKKVCGILSEATTDFESGHIHWVVVGIGLNFRTGPEPFPQELRTVAGALYSDGEPQVTRNALVAEILNRLLGAQTPHAAPELLARYRRRLLWLGQRVNVVGPQGTYAALAVDIDDVGRLLVQTASGETHALSYGEIHLQPSSE